MDLFLAWLAGFIDGEGCFVIVRRPQGAGRTTSYGCELRLRLRDDDAAILHEIVARTGLGGVHREKARSGHPQALWRVSGKADCQSLADILDRYPLRAKKARDYSIWREALREWCALDRPRGGLRKASDWTRMAHLHLQLKQVRRYPINEEVTDGRRTQDPQ